MTLRKARVVAVHPNSRTVDLVFTDNGQRVGGVEVMGDASTSGCAWRIPDVPPPSSESNAAGIETQMRNLVAYCGTFGPAQMPIVVGFSRPVNGITPSEQNRWLDVHDVSGSYMTFAPDGSYEVFIPGGGVLRIGTGGHQDLTELLASGAMESAGPAEISLTLATAHGTLSLSPQGTWTLTGAQLNVECNMNVTGTLSVSGNASIGGSLSVTNDATIGGKGFLEHKHGSVESGESQTSTPV